MPAKGPISGLFSSREFPLWISVAIALAVLVTLQTTAGQNTSSNNQVSGSSAVELQSHQVEPDFKVQVERNLVVVRAVVLDSTGHAVQGLRQEDFLIFDNGKPQTITQFAVETPPLNSPSSEKALRGTQPDAALLSETAQPASMPHRYVALLFDDIHMSYEDIVRTREAAERYLSSALQPGDRVAVFTTSGQTTLDFTNDRTLIQQAFLRLLPRPIVPVGVKGCPEVPDYQAFLMIHRRDPHAIEVATEETLHCSYENAPIASLEDVQNQAESRAESAAIHTLSFAETQTEYVQRELEQLIRRIALMPGQRQIVLISPGVFTLTQVRMEDDIAERALRANVVIDTLDSKGLFAPVAPGDASQQPNVDPRRPDLFAQKSLMILEGYRRDEDLLRDLARDTGGKCFQNSNDLVEGFREVGGLPAVSYILAFSPRSLKRDGRFHSITVKLAKPIRYTVEARRGYYAPKAPFNAAAQAKDEIEQALFSQDSLNELPIEVHTQFFKLNENEAKLAVLTHIDLRLLRFRKDQGRNLNNLTIVTALFDMDGKYLTAKEERLEFRLRDASLEQLSQTGLLMSSSFDLKPGTYLVREVVRAEDGGQLSGLSRTVEIPF